MSEAAGKRPVPSMSRLHSPRSEVVAGKQQCKPMGVTVGRKPAINWREDGRAYAALRGQRLTQSPGPLIDAVGRAWGQGRQVRKAG